MSRPNAARAYFERIYPLLRGTSSFPLSTWTRRWTEPGHSERMAWVLSELEGVSGCHVLDAGCGEGTYAAALASRGHRVTAIDFSPAMVEATRALARAAGVSQRVEVIHADLRSWLPRAPYDVVLCLGVAEYYDDASEMLERLCDLASDRFLISLSRTAGGPRNVLRRCWLLSNGVTCRFYRRDDLPAILPAMRVSRADVRETRWTYCITVRRDAGRIHGDAVHAAGPACAPMREASTW